MEDARRRAETDRGDPQTQVWTFRSLWEHTISLEAEADRRYNVRFESILALIAETDRRYTALIAGIDARFEALDVRATERLAMVRGLLDDRAAVARTHTDQAVAALENAMLLNDAARRENVALALEAADRAVSKAEVATEKRFEAMNGFRATLADQQRMLMPRAEVEALSKANMDRHALLNAQVVNQDMQIRSVVEQVAAFKSMQQAESSSFAGGWAMAFGLVGTVIAIISIAIAFLRHS